MGRTKELLARLRKAATNNTITPKQAALFTEAADYIQEAVDLAREVKKKFYG